MNKIDYEITVDVRGFSVKKKKRAQDAFFNLGYKWFGTQAKMHFGLERDEVYAYTNAFDDGDVDDHIMCAPVFRAPTHTYNQLMELAGMTDKKQLSDLNSDELRTKLAKNGGKMARLKLQNDEIVELLHSRALATIDNEAEVALTVDELKAGGWWCADVSEDCGNAFKFKGLRVVNSDEWGVGVNLVGCGLDDRGGVTRCIFDFEGEKQIHRIGNEFYWGKP